MWMFQIYTTQKKSFELMEIQNVLRKRTKDAPVSGTLSTGKDGDIFKIISLYH